LRLIKEEAWRREQLHNNIQHFRQQAKNSHLQLMDSQTPIQPILIGDNSRVMEMGRQLEEKGFLVGAIRPPTVPEGSARLRITLCAEHTHDEIDSLLDALQAVLHG
jgi:8-amino-7-oxononanoate synthase